MSGEFDPDGPYIYYDCENYGQAVFVRRCIKCNRFVKADKSIVVNEETGLNPGPNAICRKDGRVEMLFQGFF